MEEDRVTRAQRILEVPAETIYELMERHRGAREIMFTSGEPTMNRYFLRYVKRARELGFESVGVITNGRRFAYERFARAALKAGLNHVVVSIHGASQVQHDRQTRAASSYAQTVLGLRALSSLRREYEIRLHTATVVSRRNYTTFYELWQSLNGLHIDQHVFNMLQPVGRAEQAFDRLMPRFSDVVTAFREFLEKLPEGHAPVFLLDVPYCVTESLPDAVRGFVERYQYYEHEDGLDDDLRAAVLEDGADPACPEEGGGPELRRLTRRELDETRKTKRAECRTCRHEPFCDGVWNRYLDAYGWDEFQPVPAEAGETRSAENRSAPTGEPKT